MSRYRCRHCSLLRPPRDCRLRPGDRHAGARGESPPPAATPTGSAALTGAGATFPEPDLHQVVRCVRPGDRRPDQLPVHRLGRRHPPVHRGHRGLRRHRRPMTDEQIAAVKGNVLHVPTVLGAVVVTYNLPSLGNTPLRFDGPTLADIFLGRITRWNDRRLAALNPGVSCRPRTSSWSTGRTAPARATSSPTTSPRSRPTGRRKVGTGDLGRSGPIGLGGKGNEGVTQQVKQSDGAIGYVELIYAISNGLPAAEIRNCRRRSSSRPRSRP